MAIFYHGTCRLFDKFSLSHLGEGEGKSKFGHGIYLTSRYTTAALYGSKAAKANSVDTVYVYTVEVPDITDDNHVRLLCPVNADIVARTVAKLGEEMPAEVLADGKQFRKYLGNVLTNNIGTVKKMSDKADATAENAATVFLDEIGVKYLVWPVVYSKPDGDVNCAVLNGDTITIVGVDQVKVDDKNKLVEGSQIKVK